MFISSGGVEKNGKKLMLILFFVFIIYGNDVEELKIIEKYDNGQKKIVHKYIELGGQKKLIEKMEYDENGKVISIKNIINKTEKKYGYYKNGNKEFEEFMLSLFLIDKYFSSERVLSFGTNQERKINEVKEDVEKLYNFLTGRKISIKVVPIRKNKIKQKRDSEKHS